MVACRFVTMVACRFVCCPRAMLTPPPPPPPHRIVLSQVHGLRAILTPTTLSYQGYMY
jgi:hypothetical protein